MKRIFFLVCLASLAFSGCDRPKDTTTTVVTPATPAPVQPKNTTVVVVAPTPVPAAAPAAAPTAAPAPK